MRRRKFISPLSAVAGGQTMRFVPLFLALLIASPVHARWKPQYASSPYAAWYESQRGIVVNDPLGQGFVSNLTHPGSNVSGFSFIEPEIVGKWINLLSDVKPD